LFYDRSGGGKKFRTVASANLAWWHTYKHGAFEVWKKFKDSLIAPLFHHFYPGHIFFPKPSSLVMVLAFFQWIRLSYTGALKLKLVETIRRNDVSHLMKVALKDLQFLCEFAIPTVDSCIFIFSFFLVIIFMCYHDIIYFQFLQFHFINIMKKLQVLDYGLALKCNSGHMGLKCLLRMLQLLIILAETKSNTYIRSVIMQILIVLHQKHHNLPSWRLLKNSLSLFNEEAGEMSFSVLSRCVLGDTIKHKLDYMNNMYRSIHFMQEVDLELREDNGKKFTQDINFRRVYTEESPEVRSTKEFILSMIRKAIHGTLKQYDGKDAGYKSSEHSILHQINMIRTAPLWELDVFDMLDKHIDKAKQFFIKTNFGQKHRFIWPEMVLNDDHLPVVQIDDSDDFSLSGSELEDKGEDCIADDDENDNSEFVKGLHRHDNDDSDSSSSSSDMSQQDQPPRAKNIVARRAAQSDYAKDDTPPSCNRNCDKEMSDEASNDSDQSSVVDLSKKPDDNHDNQAGGAGMSKSQSPSPDPNSWAAPNKSHMNPRNIMSSSRKRSRTKVDHGFQVNDQDEDEGNETDVSD
jgi:hypothetical protein